MPNPAALEHASSTQAIPASAHRRCTHWEMTSGHRELGKDQLKDGSQNRVRSVVHTLATTPPLT
jgi:hypothetical protein